MLYDFSMQSRLDREKIARKAIAKLGVWRAKDGTHKVVPPTPNPTGFEGVDILPSGRFRARICFSSALDGQFCRITLGTYTDAEEAGLAYRAAHIHLWGSLSYFVGELTCDVLVS